MDTFTVQVPRSSTLHHDVMLVHHLAHHLLHQLLMFFHPFLLLLLCHPFARFHRLHLPHRFLHHLHVRLQELVALGALRL